MSRSTARDLCLIFLGLVIGFYLGLLAVILYVGGATFNEALPVPQRLVITIPAFAATAFYGWTLFCHDPDSNS
jgi:hypothetical protein